MIEPKVIGTLVVVAGQAKNLPNKSRFGKQDPFVTVKIGNIKRRTQPIKRGGQHPEWDEELRFPVYEDVDDMLAASTSKPLPGEPGVVTPQSLASKSRKQGPKKGGKAMSVAVWADEVKEPELIGEVTVNYDEAIAKGELDNWYELKAKDGKFAGELYLEVTYYAHFGQPPPKRNNTRLSQHGRPPAGGSPQHPPGRPGLPTSHSVSGMHLYNPPYQQAQPPPRPPAPPQLGGYANQTPPRPQQHMPQRPVSNTYMPNSFAELGLPPQPPQLHGTGGRPHPSAANALASQMGSMSLGVSHQQRPAPNPHQAATIGHGRPQSYVGATPPQQPPQQLQNSGAPVPWSALLPPTQVATPPSHAPRPVSSNDMTAFNPNDPHASALPPRPHSSIQQQPPQPAPGHGRTGSLSLAPPSVGSPPVQYGNNFQPMHQNPPTGSQVAAFPQPHTTATQSPQPPPLPQPPQLGGYQQPQQQQQAYPPTQPPPAQQGPYGAQQPPRQGTWPQSPAGQPGYQQPGAPSGSVPQPPGAYPNPPYGSPGQQHQPTPPHRNSMPPVPTAPPTTTTGPYVPWHMQTPAVHGSPGGPPAPPAPPRPGAGYYPSDELYQKQQLAGPQHQQPAAPQHPHTLPPAQQPLPPPVPPPPQHVPQNYGYTSPPPPPQPPVSSFGSPQPQPQAPPQSNFRPNAPPRVPSPISYAPVPPPRQPSPLPPNAQPPISPPTNTDWRSYLQGLGQVGGGAPPPPPPVPPASDWYPPAAGASNTMQHAQAQTGYAPPKW